MCVEIMVFPWCFLDVEPSWGESAGHAQGGRKFSANAVAIDCKWCYFSVFTR